MSGGRPGSTLLSCFAYFDDPQPVPHSLGHVVVDATICSTLESKDMAPIICSLRYLNDDLVETIPQGWYRVLAKIVKYVPGIHPKSFKQNDGQFALLGDIISLTAVTQEYVLACVDIPARLTVTGFVYAVEEDLNSFVVINWQPITNGPILPHLNIRAVMGLTQPTVRSSVILPWNGFNVSFTGEMLTFEDGCLVVAVTELVNLGKPVLHWQRRQFSPQLPLHNRRRGKKGTFFHRSASIAGGLL